MSSRQLNRDSYLLARKKSAVFGHKLFAIFVVCIRIDGRKEILALGIQASGSKYAWMHIFDELKVCGV
ncbi:MAG: transposase [Selenomonadaceae bacterium]|nr:transposase [Selenomonadaceae bacterium]